MQSSCSGVAREGQQLQKEREVGQRKAHLDEHYELGEGLLGKGGELVLD